VAASALAREESRGAHQRSDFPQTDPALDAHHSVVDAGGEAPALVCWE
jgi:L-aspartate oxidase